MNTDKLYKNYKSASDVKIRKHLDRIRILKKDGDKFYEYTPEAIKKAYEKPRNVSLSFEGSNTTEFEMKHMIEVKEITYLCKSSSRFFLKPDIGEIFDQINETELNRINGIAFNQDYKGPINDEGDHFIMKAWLLVYDRQKKLERILKDDKEI